jgi:hypothetical protein
MHSDRLAGVLSSHTLKGERDSRHVEMGVDARRTVERGWLNFLARNALVKERLGHQKSAM